MKKLILLLLLPLLFLIKPISAHAETQIPERPTNGIYDPQNYVTNKVSTRLAEFNSSSDTQIGVYIVDTLDGKNIDKQANVIVQRLMEWLLTDSNLFAATIFGILGVVALLSIIDVSTPDEKNSKICEFINGFCAIALSVAPLLIIITALTIKFETQLEYSSNSEWKEIYTNNINAEIILNLKTDEGYLISNATGGKSLGSDYKDYNTNSNMNGTILAKNGDLEETKTIHVNKSDIIYEGELTPTSKITKIEYRPAEQMYKTVFGYNGKPSDADKDGLVRITISDDNSPERTALKNLFTNESN